MPIIKPYSPCSGSRGKFWKIVQVNINLVASEAETVLALYKDEKAAEKEPHKFIMTLAGRFKIDKKLLIKGNLLKFLYDKLKESTTMEGDDKPFFGEVAVATTPRPKKSAAK